MSHTSVIQRQDLVILVNFNTLKLWHIAGNKLRKRGSIESDMAVKSVLSFLYNGTKSGNEAE
jgi:hypothetical protein